METKPKTSGRDLFLKRDRGTHTEQAIVPFSGDLFIMTKNGDLDVYTKEKMAQLLTGFKVWYQGDCAQEWQEWINTKKYNSRGIGWRVDCPVRVTVTTDIQNLKNVLEMVGLDISKFDSVFGAGK